MDEPGDSTMSAITKHDGAFSLYLVSLSAVITATVGVLFGIGFLLRGWSPLRMAGVMSGAQQSDIGHLALPLTP